MKQEKGSFMGTYDLKAAWANMDLRKLDQILPPSIGKSSHKATPALTQRQYRQEQKKKGLLSNQTNTQMQAAQAAQREQQQEE